MHIFSNIHVELVDTIRVQHQHYALCDVERLWCCHSFSHSNLNEMYYARVTWTKCISPVSCCNLMDLILCNVCFPRKSAAHCTPPLFDYIVIKGCLLIIDQTCKICIMKLIEFLIDRSLYWLGLLKNLTLNITNVKPRLCGFEIW